MPPFWPNDNPVHGDCAPCKASSRASTLLPMQEPSSDDDLGVPFVTEIHVAPASRLPMKRIDSVYAEAGVGLVGDRYHGTRHRHVSVQSALGLADAAGDLGRSIAAGDTRRNITISHGEVPTKPGSRIEVGSVQLEVVRIAAPCRLLDDVIGDGARTALRRRAGSICRVLTSGTIEVGDSVALMPLDDVNPAG